MRDDLIEKYPKVMSTDNIGQIPNDALFHAEVTVLLRAARANGGTLEGKTVEVTVDREMCNSCKKGASAHWPGVGQSHGDVY
jgi:NMD protein affecting ribosome stability and mRNA decay